MTTVFLTLLLSGALLAMGRMLHRKGYTSRDRRFQVWAYYLAASVVLAKGLMVIIGGWT